MGGFKTASKEPAPLSYRIEIIKTPGSGQEEPLKIRAWVRVKDKVEEKESDFPELSNKKDQFSFLVVLISVLIQRVSEEAGVETANVKHPILGIKPEGLAVLLEAVESLGKGTEKTKRLWIKLALAPELETGKPLASFEAWSEAGVVEAFCFRIAEGVREREIVELSNALMRYLGYSSLRARSR